ncbi:DUF1428 domain-containing protein [Sphingomonas floccifaciens]|uniref:DUF1428 domain-containing protein n=1 Tax=Sphingomonas floccifaciens TaxID=1844115 RepID=A0ABW4NDJ7_9SPHN
MTYIEGFLTPVPTANRDRYLDHARAAVPMFKDFGAARMVEAWGEDVPRGQRNDLWMAVAAEEGEAVVFSWFEYPDKATRDAANARMMADPRLAEMMQDMPFDGGRMIMGGFDSVSDAGSGSGRNAGFIDGVVLPLKADARETYRDFASSLAPIFLEFGALRVLDAVADDVPTGERTDFYRAVCAEKGEPPAFGFVEWPDRATRDAGWNAIMADPRMQDQTPPFDGKRMIFGGFAVIVDA